MSRRNDRGGASPHFPSPSGFRGRPAPRPAAILAALLLAWWLQPAVSGGVSDAEAAHSGSDRGTVVILSLDGFRHDYPNRVETPAFDRLAREGARAQGVLPPFPSQTFPSHATLATGAPPGVHGILNNAFFDRARGPYYMEDDPNWYEVPPLWIVAERAGLRAHVYHWIGSGGAFRGTQPTWWARYDKRIRDLAKIRTIRRWLALPPERRPHLIMSYLRGCDGPGHDFGPDAAVVSACIRAADAALGALLVGIDNLLRAKDLQVTLFVVSDHGMMTTAGEINPVVALREISSAARIVPMGPVAHIYMPSGAAARNLLARARALPHTSAYLRSALPPEWHYDHPQRTGDIVLVADPGYRFNADIPDVTSAPRLAGHHGHPATHPDMPGVFYAWGHGIAAGVVTDAIDATDLVPTVCALLGIKRPSHAKGEVRRAIMTR